MLKDILPMSTGTRSATHLLIQHGSQPDMPGRSAFHVGESLIDGRRRKISNLVRASKPSKVAQKPGDLCNFFPCRPIVSCRSQAGAAGYFGSLADQCRAEADG